MEEFTHFDDQGASRMVNVGDKQATRRRARAAAAVKMLPATLEKITRNDLSKGNVLEVARLAGIMATKQTGNLIPLCHPIGIDGAEVEFTIEKPNTVVIEATVGVFARTGVEMEALTAVSVAALTIYDMCKSVDREMTIENIRLLEKSGGKSGDFVRVD
ncbi:MAG: cyclic pyranopterin monophosphate synthase MoaC [Planctomycetaceae bacterium]|nr:cyclic pyranopterin monophosphate synthase MoaC [Planctomycetaceae bacterium]|tara:strand:- start:406 stop:882 length:477 start_codon:yes stop_codon:yes gene_type:complete